MKRIILASLIGLLASGAYASDLSYGGPYSQMKVKLCSDTPPSRSILPDGSLICDDNPPTNDTYCTGGFVYADTDIFNCGSQVDQDGDLNNNGTPDDIEDWDGDGIPNGVDPDPYKPNQTPNADHNGNNIPDSLDPYVDVLNEVEITRASIQCDNSAECSVLRALNRRLYDTGLTNRSLANSISRLATESLTKDDLKIVSSGISNSIKDFEDQQWTVKAEILDDIVSSEANIISAIRNVDLDNSELIKMLEDAKLVADDSNTKVTDVDNRLLMVSGEVSQTKLNTTILSSDIAGVSRKIDEVTSTLYDLDFDGGLTTSQERNLKNASKAKANNSMLQGLTRTAIQTRNDVDTVLDDIGALNSKIDSLESSISSAVDLTGVTSSIDALSSKIDGLDGGSDGEGLAEISGKLDGLATGVTDIGDLLKGVDSSKAGINGTCIQGGTCQGFYDSAYEGDLSDVLESQLQTMKTSVVDPFVSNFGNIDLSGAKRPNFGLPVPFYGYFSFDDYIDLDWIFGFLRFIFLASTAFYCRQIIFGG